MSVSGSAQTVYKCRDAKGGPVYQSFPCPGNAPPEKTWSGTYRKPTNDELWERYRRDQEWARRQERERAKRGTQTFFVPPTTEAATKEAFNRSACASVRAEYDRVQADFKLNRNIELLRRLEAQIRTYCVVRP